MAIRKLTIRLEEQQLKRAGRYLKTRKPTETVRAALDLVTEKATHERVVRKYSGVGRPDAFANS
jgi:hypothetical protein